MSSLGTAAIASMDKRLAWFRAMSAENRSWLGLVAQAGILTPEIPIGPFVRLTQLLATIRSTSAEQSVTITKNGPRNRRVTAPMTRPTSNF